MMWGYLYLAFALVVLMCVLGLSGCTSTADLAAVVAQLRGDTASDCITVEGPWGTVTAVRVNQNSTTVELPCKISQGTTMAPTIILPAAPAMQVIKP